MSDALTSLRTALAPKQGMRKIPLALETYQHQSVPLSSKLLMNMLAEQEPAYLASNEQWRVLWRFGKLQT